jgi:hypothetical protein
MVSKPKRGMRRRGDADLWGEMKVVVQRFFSPAHEWGRVADCGERHGGALEGGDTAWQHKEGDAPGWADLGGSGARSWAKILEHGPTSWNSKENRVGLANRFWAEMIDQIKRPAEIPFEFKQGFWVQKSKIEILLNWIWTETKLR